MIKKELKTYIKSEIFPLYEKKDWSRQIWHIYNVISRSLNLAKNYKVDENIIYTIIAFHDIAHNNEKSAKMIQKDKMLPIFFSKNEITLIINTVKSQNKEPHTIYEKILATAKQFESIEEVLKSTHLQNLEFTPNKSLDEMFDSCKDFIDKIYSSKEMTKTYLPSPFLKQFQKEMEYYHNHYYELKEKFYKIDKFLRKKYDIKPAAYTFYKRYYSLDEYLKKKYNEKVYKVSLNAGFDCPNIKNGHGCIFCSHQSGDFAGKKEEDLVTQFQKIQKKMEQKWKKGKYIAYFQAGTNTYAPLPILKEKFESVINLPGVIGLDIATRSDAISKEVLTYLEELNKKTDLTIELGLQSIHQKTLDFINRGHTFENFKKMVLELNKRHIKVVVHIINGLPYETKKQMVETVECLNKLPIHGIKIHMLHILKDTPLENLYRNQPFPLLKKEDYIEIVCDQIERLNKNIVIHRLTGDPKKEDLIAPTWLLKKFVVLNDIEKELEKRDSWQGKLT